MNDNHSQSEFAGLEWKRNTKVEDMYSAVKRLECYDATHWIVLFRVTGSGEQWSLKIFGGIRTIFLENKFASKDDAMTHAYNIWLFRFRV